MAEAAEVYRHALRIREAIQGGDHPTLAQILGNVGALELRLGKYAEAEPLLLKAKAIHEKILGTNHPLFVQSQEDLAILYWKQKNFTKAYPLYKPLVVLE